MKMFLLKFFIKCVLGYYHKKTRRFGHYHPFTFQDFILQTENIITNAALHDFKSVDYNIEGYDIQLVSLSKVKVGPLVMLRKNLTDELYNGRIGTITKIQSEVIHVLFDYKEILIERYNEDHHGAGNKVVARRRNFTLILSFARTVHKS